MKKKLARETDSTRKKRDADAEHRRRDREMAKRGERDQRERKQREAIAELDAADRALVDNMIGQCVAATNLLRAQLVIAMGDEDRNVTLADIAALAHQIATSKESWAAGLRADATSEAITMYALSRLLRSLVQLWTPDPDLAVARAERAMDFGAPHSTACRIAVGERGADALRHRVKKRGIE